MCGRYTQHHKQSDVVARFDVQHNLFTVAPRYNIAPTQVVPVIVADSKQHERYLEGFQWGLVPEWAKDTSIASKLINARAETLTEKPAYRNAFRYHRCLIPADGFYEWEKINNVRQPYHFHLKDSDLFAFAGLYARWHPPQGEGEDVYTFTVITTSANSLVAPIHDRMPVILQSPEDEAHWLNPTITDPRELSKLLVPLPPERMNSHTANRRVGSVVNDDSTLLVAAAA